MGPMLLRSWFRCTEGGGETLSFLSSLSECHVSLSQRNRHGGEMRVGVPGR